MRDQITSAKDAKEAAQELQVWDSYQRPLSNMFLITESAVQTSETA